MRQVVNVQPVASLNKDAGRNRRQSLDLMRRFNALDMVCVLLPLCALVLWAVSLKDVHVGQMNDLGLVPVLTPSIFLALGMLMLSFCLALRQPQMRTPILFLHLVLLIVMLYGMPDLLEGTPRFSWTYQNAGYTEYIMRTGTINQGLDFYFNWPGFFILSALITQVAGLHDVLGFANWASVLLNLMYLGPLALIFAAVTPDKRVVWLGLCFFLLTNWVQQDTYSPQGLNYFLYLVAIAILLKWFKIAPVRRLAKVEAFVRSVDRLSRFPRKVYAWLMAQDTLCTASRPGQRVALLVMLITICAFMISSHPLTPFFLIASVTALVIFRRCKPFWLPVLLTIMVAAWILLMAQAFLVGHISMITGNVGSVSDTVAANVTDRVAQGSPEHIVIDKLRVITTIVLWGLAYIGAVRRFWKGGHDVISLLLMVAPFSLIVLQSYGGEMFLRIYFFTLPFMVLFAAFLFLPVQGVSYRGIPLTYTVAIAGISLLLLGGFLFTRYGNERMDYKSPQELEGVAYLYKVAPANALFIEGWSDTPWLYKDYEKYTLYSMMDVMPDVVTTRNITVVDRFIQSQKYSQAYVILTRSQGADARLFYGLPPDTPGRLEAALLKSGDFRLLYHNSDAQVLLYVDGRK